MIRTIVAIADDALRDSIIRILQKNGIEVRISCRSGQEALRAVNRMDGGVVICSARLTDMTADELADTLGTDALFLVLARPSELDYCENENLFRVPLPVHSGELIGGVRILLQLDEHSVAARLPKRTDEDKAVITQAKEVLMDKNEMTEEQAYRFIQKRSMETSTPMPDVAKMILTALS
ncbi:MAG: response regulator [Lachnospiraceae bacterium]|nr:response regulator [Lachnospiraceae bacterium]